MGLTDVARFEIDFRLKTKESDYANALLLAAGLAFEAVADDGLVFPGQPLKASLAVVNRGAADVAVSDVSLTGFEKPASCEPGAAKARSVFTCTADVQVPKDAKYTEPYWTDEYWEARPQKAALNIYAPDVEFGVPFRPTPFRIAVKVRVGSVEGDEGPRDSVPHLGRTRSSGEKRMELNVVPAFSVRTTPETAVIAGGRPTATTREILVLRDQRHEGRGARRPHLSMCRRAGRLHRRRPR